MSTLLDEQPMEKRPKLLSVLGILSWIAIGLGFLSSTFSLITGPMNEAELNTFKVSMTQSANQMRDLGMTSFENMMRKSILATEALNANHYAHQLLTLLILIIGATGVFLMFKGKKIGFHAYIVYCLLSSVLIYLFVSPANVPTFTLVTGLIISGVFILLYSRTLKWMK